MTDMIERVARALYEADPDKETLVINVGPHAGAVTIHPISWENTDDVARDCAFEAAIVALKAIREPTPEMVAAGAKATWDTLVDGSQVMEVQSFQAMIDTALKTEDPGQ